VDGAMVVLLRFIQPVRPADVATHLTASLERHTWVTPPALTPEEQDRLMELDPNASRAFAQKVEATRQIAAGGPAVICD
jgi:DNA primase